MSKADGDGLYDDDGRCLYVRSQMLVMKLRNCLFTGTSHYCGERRVPWVEWEHRRHLQNFTRWVESPGNTTWRNKCEESAGGSGREDSWWPVIGWLAVAGGCGMCPSSLFFNVSDKKLYAKIKLKMR